MKIEFNKNKLKRDLFDLYVVVILIIGILAIVMFLGILTLLLFSLIDPFISLITKNITTKIINGLFPGSSDYPNQIHITTYLIILLTVIITYLLFFKIKEKYFTIIREVD